MQSGGAYGISRHLQDSKSPIYDVHFHSTHSDLRNKSTVENQSVCTDSVTNPCLYSPANEIKEIYALCVSNVRVPLQWSRVSQSVQSSGGLLAIELVKADGTVNTRSFQFLTKTDGTITNPAVKNLVNAQFQNSTGVSSVYRGDTKFGYDRLYRFNLDNTNSDGYVKFRFKDTFVARVFLGLKNFDAYMEAKSLNTFDTFPDQVSVDDTLPTLYLHANLSTESEQNKVSNNIIYTYYPSYVDGEQKFQASEKNKEIMYNPLNSKIRTLNTMRLEWRLSNGELAELNGAEWEAKFQFFTADATQDNFINNSTITPMMF